MPWFPSPSPSVLPDRHCISPSPSVQHLWDSSSVARVWPAATCKSGKVISGKKTKYEVEAIASRFLLLVTRLEAIASRFLLLLVMLVPTGSRMSIDNFTKSEIWNMTWKKQWLLVIVLTTGSKPLYYYILINMSLSNMTSHECCPGVQQSEPWSNNNY